MNKNNHIRIGGGEMNKIKKEMIGKYQIKNKKNKFWFYFILIGLAMLLSVLNNDWSMLGLFLLISTITIVLDSATTFDSTGAEYNAIARLSDTKFVIAFRDADDQNKGKVIIGTRSGTTITIENDSATVFEFGQTDNISVCAMDETHFIVAYRDVSDSSHGKMVACSVSDTTITVGGVTDFYTTAAVADATAVSSFDSTHFIVVWRGTSNDTLGRIGSLSGITITLGDETLITNAYNGLLVDCDTLNTTKFIVIYNFNNSNQYVYGKIGTADTANKTFTLGAEKQISSISAPVSISISCFDESYFVAAFAASAAAGKVRIGNIEGDAITMGSEVDFNADTSTYISVATMDSTHFVVCYRDEGNLNKGTVRGGSISGTTITLDTDGEIPFESGDTTYLAIARLVDNYFVIAFKDNG